MVSTELEKKFDRQHTDVPAWMRKAATKKALRVESWKRASGAEPRLEHLIVGLRKGRVGSRGNLGVP